MEGILKPLVPDPAVTSLMPANYPGNVARPGG
jgi:hypothetical protein